MIYGIGIDLVEISRMEQVMQRWGARFIHRVFTRKEAAFCSGRAFPASAFALRFAAKEAFSKAMGTGMRKGVRWRDIEVTSLPGGKPNLMLHGLSRALCREVDVSHVHVSLTDEGAYAAAVVVLECAAGRPV